MEIVKFEDGKYGIRKGKKYFKYLDLDAGSFWWSQDSEYFKCCKSDLKTVEKYFIDLNDCGKPLTSSKPSFFKKLINTLKTIEWEK